jgi:hypothetical protein
VDRDNAEDMSIVERFLEEVELEQGQREEIVAIIKGMGFKNEVSKKSVVEPTLEFAIVQDADRLDAIGAIGKYCITEVSLSALLKQSFLQQLGCSKCCTGYAKSFPCTILFFPLLPLDSDGINLSSVCHFASSFSFSILTSAHISLFLPLLIEVRHNLFLGFNRTVTYVLLS